MMTLTSVKPGRKYKRCHGATVTPSASKVTGPILPDHPLWPIFKDTLKSLLDFNGVFQDNENPIMLLNTVHCLKNLGLSEADVINNLFIFKKYGGHSDLEVLYNVQRNFNGTINPQKRKIIFILYTGLGDDVATTGILREIREKYPAYSIDIRTRHKDLFLYNPNITSLNESADDVEICVLRFDCMPIDLIESNLDIHFNEMHFSSQLHCIAQSKLNLQWDYKNIKPDLHLGDTLNPVSEKIGFKGPYWLLNSGFHNIAPEKWYPHYQKVIDLLQGKVQFVQHGGPSDTHTKLNGVLSIIGQTTPLELAAAFPNCSGSLGGLSSHMHLAAAFDRPCVVVAGGIEHPGSINYKNQTILFKNECNKTGRGCFLKKTSCLHFSGDHAAFCMDSITPEMVANEILKYPLVNN
jgi:ADP-heptose:LPS heptosyltransferase